MPRRRHDATPRATTCFAADIFAACLSARAAAAAADAILRHAARCSPRFDAAA